MKGIPYGKVKKYFMELNKRAYKLDILCEITIHGVWS